VGDACVYFGGVCCPCCELRTGALAKSSLISDFGRERGVAVRKGHAKLAEPVEAESEQEGKAKWGVKAGPKPGGCCFGIFQCRAR